MLQREAAETGELAMSKSTTAWMVCTTAACGNTVALPVAIVRGSFQCISGSGNIMISRAQWYVAYCFVDSRERSQSSGLRITGMDGLGKLW